MLLSVASSMVWSGANSNVEGLSTRYLSFDCKYMIYLYYTKCNLLRKFIGFSVRDGLHKARGFLWHFGRFFVMKLHSIS